MSTSWIFDSCSVYVELASSCLIEYRLSGMLKEAPLEMNRFPLASFLSIFAQITGYPYTYCTEHCRSIVSPILTTFSPEMCDIIGFCWPSVGSVIILMPINSIDVILNGNHDSVFGKFGILVFQ